MDRKTIKIGIVLTGLLLAISIATLPDYGLTWDFHFHFFSGANFFGLKPADVEPRALPYVEPDPRNAVRLPYGPFVQILPFASWLVFYKQLALLPFDVAYNLPIVIAGVLGITVLYFFLAEAINWKVGFLAAIFLFLTPRYFSDFHNDMKDAPMAAVFALNLWMLWRLVKYHRVKDLIFASVAFALAFNTKINSIFIPAILAGWLILLKLINSKHEIRSTKQIQNSNAKNPKLFDVWNFLHWNLFRISNLEFLYFLAAPAAAFLLWWFFWGDPIGQLKLAVSTFGGGADNIEVLLNGQWFCAGSTVPWYYPLWYLAITTPLPILLSFIIGVIWSISTVLVIQRTHKKTLNGYDARIGYVPRQSSDDTHFVTDFRTSSLLLILWLFLPLSRYLLPKIAVIDGVRHFEEVLYPVAAIAAFGFVQITKNIRPVFAAILFSLVISHMSYVMFSSHPFQITYYNELIGGARGAFGKYDLDYWGSSQKKAVEWLNASAQKDASVTIIMAGNVAGTYLRPDLLARLNTMSIENADYSIVLNRQSFFYRFFNVFDYLLTHKPIHTIEVNGAPLVWIFDNRLPQTPRQTPWWQGEDPCIRKYW